MAKTRDMSSVWVVIIFHCIVLLFHHTTVVSGYTCSRCTSEDSKSAFGPPERWTCSENEATIDNDFTRIPELGNPDNECDCRQQQTKFRYCCELEEIYNNEDNEDSESEDVLIDTICRCRNRCYREPACPANKCDYSFQCDTTLYVCWNLVSPQDLGILGETTSTSPPSPTFTPKGSPTFTPKGSPAFTPKGSPTFTPKGSPTFTPKGSPTFTPKGSPTFTPKGSPTPTTPPTSTDDNVNDDEEEVDTSCSTPSGGPEIEDIVYCIDRKDNIYEAPGENECDTLCSPIDIQTVMEDDPTNSTIIGIKVCPNGKTVTQYTKFCSPDNEVGGPPDGLSFTTCPGGSSSDCQLPFCEYENEFNLTQVPSELPPSEAATTITCPDDIILDISYTNDGHPLPISVEYDDPIVVVANTTSSSNNSSSCPLNITVQQSEGLASGSLFPVGTTTNTYEAIISQGSDDNGTTILSTSSSCSFDISIVDNEPPMIICPGNITVGYVSSSCITVTVYYGPIETSDNSPGVLTVLQLNGLSSGARYPVGNTTRNTFQVTDTSGNTNTCSFDVHVVGDDDDDDDDSGTRWENCLVNNQSPKESPSPTTSNGSNSKSQRRRNRRMTRTKGDSTPTP